MIKKISLILIIFLMVVVPVSADLNLGLKAPDNFVYSPTEGLENNEDFFINRDEYVMKNDSNTLLAIMEYDDQTWEALVTPGEEPTSLYFVHSFESNKNIHVYNYLDADDFCCSGASEVIEYNGQMYIANILFVQKTIDTVDQEKDAVSYLEEFNRLNDLEPIEM